MDAKKTASEIEQEAAQWVIRLDQGGRTVALESELADWLSADRRHQGAFLQAEAAWMLLGKVSIAGPATHENPARNRMPRGRATKWLAAALAAGLAALALNIALRTPTLKAPAGTYALSSQYSTEQGEISRVELEDGSSISLNSSSALTVEYRDDVRALTLSSGEVWFDVAKDAKRPFLVAVGDARVRAVGTGFAVHMTVSEIDVSVTEGVVEVWTLDAPEDISRLRVGDGVVVSAQRVGPVQQRGTKQIEDRLQWRFRKIDLAGQTLQQAIEKFNLHNQRKLVIADPKIAGERLHGVFQLTDPEGFARAVQTSLSIPIDLSRPDQITLGEKE